MTIYITKARVLVINRLSQLEWSSSGQQDPQVQRELKQEKAALLSVGEVSIKRWEWKESTCEASLSRKRNPGNGKQEGEKAMPERVPIICWFFFI